MTQKRDTVITLQCPPHHLQHLPLAVCLSYQCCIISVPLRMGGNLEEWHTLCTDSSGLPLCRRNFSTALHTVR